MSEDISRELGRLAEAITRINASMDRHEEEIAKHANELAETRGAARANKWLAIALPPAVVAAVEGFKAFFHAGGAH